MSGDCSFVGCVSTGGQNRQSEEVDILYYTLLIHSLLQFLLSGDLFGSDIGVLDDYCSSTVPYVLPVSAQPPGTVCLFGGDYSFPNYHLTVPPVPCGVSALEGVCVCVCVCVCQGYL